MKAATTFLTLGTVLIALGLLGIPPEFPGFRGFSVTFLLAGTILVITGLLLATLTAVEHRRPATAEVAPAPIKTLFPLVSFICAALFVVILGPAIISIWINLRTP